MVGGVGVEIPPLLTAHTSVGQGGRCRRMPCAHSCVCLLPPLAVLHACSPVGPERVWSIQASRELGSRVAARPSSVRDCGFFVLWNHFLPPLHTHPKELFSVPAWLPIPTAQQKDSPHLASAHSGLVTVQSPFPYLPLPWPLRLGRCEILIASLETGLFLSVVSDQNIILSCKYNYRAGALEGGGDCKVGRECAWEGRWEGAAAFSLNCLSPVC